MATKRKTAGSRKAAAWRNADHDKRRAMIVDAALALLHQRGLEAVTIRNVAQRLGVGAMTLYTYIGGQTELLAEMARQGFEMLSEGCDASSTLEIDEDWRGGSRSYLQFALDNPNLYNLMFSLPPDKGGVDESILQSGFQNLIDKVRLRLDDGSCNAAELDRRALQSAGRFWIALHGLASLAIANRLGVLGGDLDEVLDGLLECVAPS